MDGVLHQFQLSRTESGLTFDIQLDPDRRLYCFIGENAVGKTALLESLGQVIWWLHTIWHSRERREGSFQGWLTNPAFRARFESRALYVPNVLIAGQDPKRGQSWDNVSLLSLTVAHAPAKWQVDFPFVFVPAQHRATIAGVPKEALTLVGDKASAFVEAIDRGIAASRRQWNDTTSLASWITARLLVNPAFVVGMRNPHEEVSVLLDLMQRFDPDSFHGAVTRDGPVLRMNVAYLDGQLLLLGRPIDRLASGWTALLKIFQEIVSSIAAWEAVRNSTDILGSNALIFIDEIDAHLHPRWQSKLLPFLKESFPNATFVVTTHSALLVRDTEPGEGYELVRTGDRVTARRLGSPRDWYLSDVLADAFHVQLPLPGTEAGEDAPPLSEVLLDFAQKVREYGVSRTPELRESALALYQEIQPRLPQDDPRLQTVEQLRQLLT